MTPNPPPRHIARHILLLRARALIEGNGLSDIGMADALANALTQDVRDPIRASQLAANLTYSLRIIALATEDRWEIDPRLPARAALSRIETELQTARSPRSEPRLAAAVAGFLRRLRRPKFVKHARSNPMKTEDYQPSADHALRVPRDREVEAMAASFGVSTAQLRELMRKHGLDQAVLAREAEKLR